MIKKFILSIFLLFLLKSSVWGQASDHSLSNPFFVDTEWMVGEIVPNYRAFPQTGLSQSYNVNAGFLHNSPDSDFAGYYNYPMTGLSFHYSKLGNSQVLGEEISVMPYVMINPVRGMHHPFWFKFALGISYFTSPYHKVNNPGNKAIGSPFAWSFQTYLYKSWYLSPSFRVNVGGGYLHASNGHTQLPNAGLNKAMISISATAFFDDVQSIEVDYNKNKLPSHFFFNLRNGFGLHEFGNTFGPVGGPKKGVYTTALAVGFIFKDHIKVRSGFHFRFYEHYYDYITKNKPGEYIDKPFQNASNINFFVGCEFLMGHFGMDIEGGLNLYKPFYEEYFDLYRSNSTFKYFLKKMFTSRMGLNVYLFNTHHHPEHNFFLGGNINANFGMADFSEISVGYTRILK